MATYYHGNSAQVQQAAGDGLQTLILMNPNYVGYSSDTCTQPNPPGNFVFLNSNAAPTTGHGQFQQSFTHPRLPHNVQNQQFVGIPLHASTSASSDPNHDISAAIHGFIPRVHHYNMYNTTSIDTTAATREVTRVQQGLSLSLSSQQTGHGAAGQTISPTSGGDDVRVNIPGGSPSSSGISNGVQSVLLSSKYLKAAQELLDEVVNVGKGIGSDEGGKGTNNEQGKVTGGQSTVSVVAGEGLSGGGGGGETSGKHGGELTTAERQEVQMKKAKLVNMLDEVEQRYRQYHHQMQIVISWFEQTAGIGSAKTYTALALQTISKQFRCLKDAITGQIRSASKSLGEEDCFGGGGKNECSRLKYVDHHIRQQRALQQLGMIQPNAWRPQRGLPERSVSVLRAWLFEHFLHPYPKDSDKIMLAKQTGLTRSQVSNWFINARVRLWKPMVEEMYLEETKEKDKTEAEGKMSKPENGEYSSPSRSNHQQQKSVLKENEKRKFISNRENPTNTNQNTTPSAISISTASTSPTFQTHPGVSLIGSPGVESFNHASPKKQKSTEILQSPINEQLLMRFGNERHSRDDRGFTLTGPPTNFIGGFGSYSIGEMGRFSTHEQFPTTYAGNGVSLTLGLPHCENLSLSGTHQSFLPNQSIQLGRTVEIGESDEFGSISTPTSSHSPAVYENISIQSRKRFAAQLLPDFVT